MLTLRRVGRNIRAEREAQKLTQTRLAQKAKVRREHLNRTELGAGHDIRVGTLIKLAQVLGTSVSSLVRE